MSDEARSPIINPHDAPGPLLLGPRHADRVFDSLAEGVWERNLKTGEVWYSPRYKALLGFTDAELPNLMATMRARLHPDDIARVEQALAVATDSLGETVCTSRMMNRSGQWRWVRARVRVWPDDLGRPELLIGALADVHDERLANEAMNAQRAVLEQRIAERTQGLEAALQEAERANRAKASFLAHMSHELRTPLNGVMGMNELAQSLATGREQRRYLELAQQSGQALLRILDDVLDFARVEAGRLQLHAEDLDLSQLAAETLRSFMPAIRAKNLEVGFDYVGDITQVRADAGRLRQIISNLIGNAIKFTERGGVVLIVEVTAAEAGLCGVRLRVRDSGSGLDEATAARVFEPFEQGDSATNRRHGGTGLGLPIVRMLAHLMGGDVSVRSRPGLGSEFRVELRLAAHAQQPMRALAVVGAVGGHVWVLVRSHTLGRGLCRRLERIGLSADLMPDLATAIDRLQGGQAGRMPSCVVIGEDVLAARCDLGILRKALPRNVTMTLLLRPDFDLSTVHGATEQRDMKVLVAPVTPADLYTLVQPASAPAEATRSRPAPLAMTAATGRFVLVVEDNPMNQIIAREMVAALGLTPVVVGSGEDALASCRSTPPDLVLMDIQMPGMDGLETTRRLRALQAAGALRRFPIIALTAHAMASDRQASVDAGIDEHLTKPVQLEKLRSALERWLN
jgi:PAS domain S-box-containing protein